jgi:hypothetical protein
MDCRPPHVIIAARLALYLGPHTARVALKTFADRIGGQAPEALTRAQVPELLAALRPMLRTLLGRERAEGVVRQLSQEFE